MKKYWALLTTLMLITSSAFGFSKQEIIDYTIKRSLVRFDYADAHELEQRLVPNYCSQEIADFAAQLLSIKLKESAVNVKEYELLINLIKMRNSTRYRNVFQSLIDANKSFRVNELAKAALEELELGSPRQNEEPFEPTTDSFLALKKGLQQTAQQSSPIKNWDEETRKDLKKKIKEMDNMEQVYNLLGYPDNIDIGFRRGRTGVAALFEVIWQNQFRIIFVNKKRRAAAYPGNTWDFLISLKPDVIDPLDDYSNDSEMTEILTAKDPKQAKKFLRSMDKNYTLSESVLSTMQQVVDKNITNFDDKWSYNLILICQNLGRSKDPQYIATLQKAADSFSDDGLKSKTRQALYQLLTETDSTAELVKAVNSLDPEVVRLSTRAIYRQKMLSPEISNAYITILQKHHESEDRLYVSAMITMLKSFSVNERYEFLPEIKTLREQLTNKDLIAHTDKAIMNLEKLSSQVRN